MKYPHQSPKTDNQAFASGRSWVGITEVFLCCVNLSLTQKDQECERDLRTEENICLKAQSPKTEEQLFASVPRSTGLELLRYSCVV